MGKVKYAGHLELAALDLLQRTGGAFTATVHEEISPQQRTNRHTGDRLRRMREKGYVKCEGRPYWWTVTQAGLAELERCKAMGRKPGVPSPKEAGYIRPEPGQWVGPVCLDILDSLVSEGAMSTRSVAMEIGNTRNNTGKALRILRRKGYVISRHAGKGTGKIWQPTDAGRAILRSELARGRVPGVTMPPGKHYWYPQR